MSRNNYGPKAQPSSGIELIAWWFTRVSGLILLFMALIHFSMMHITMDSWNITYEWVAQRYSTPFWKTYDIIMLVLAMFHGCNGVRYVIDDYIRPQGLRVALNSLVYVATLALLIYGSVGILTFNPLLPHMQVEKSNVTEPAMLDTTAIDSTSVVTQ